MTKLLKEAIAKVRDLPEDVQDMAAEVLIRYVDEIPTVDEGTAIAEGMRAFKRKDFIPLDQWRHDVGIRNH
jgi:hypothetical protein